ncbi:MAG TPA: lipopolysaccharide biosynthesis protein [Luteimonas sp.]|nr:lipopolysaccharide biosynthesis protein [Luteimonas sp.]
MSELKQDMVDGGLWTASGRIVAILGGFVLNLVLARTLSPADYGVYFVVLSTMIILATVGTAGMDQVVVRFAAAHKAVGDWGAVRAVILRCLGMVLAATALVCVAFYPLVPWFFANVMKMPAAVALGGLMVLWLFFSTIQRQLAETFRGLSDIRLATVFGGFRNNGILVSLATCAVSLLLWWSGAMSLRAAFAMTVGASLLVVLVAGWTLWRRLQSLGEGDDAAAAPPARWSAASALHEGWPLWVVGLIAVMRAQSSGWFAAGFDSADQVALFAIAQRFVLLLTAPLAIVNALLPPVVAGLYARAETARLQNVVQAVGGLASLPCVLILALLVVAGRPTLGALFGAHYEAAYPMLVVLCVGQVANILTGSWQIVLPMTGHRKQMLRVSTSAALVQLAGTVAGGYALGAIGVALGSSIGAVFGNLLGVATVRRHLGIWTFISLRRSVLTDALALLASRAARLVPARMRG